MFNIHPVISVFFNLRPFWILYPWFEMLKVFGLLVLLSLSYSFECNEKGYDAYLEEYTFKTEGENLVQYKELDI